MATWKESPNWTPFDDINGGQQFSNMLSPEDLNKLAENIAYLYENQGENEYLGEYTGGSYRVGAIVKYSDGNIYMCIKDTDDEQEPTDTEYWEMLNEEGGGETVETWDGTGVVIAPIEEEPTTDALAGTWVLNYSPTFNITGTFDVDGTFSCLNDSDGLMYSSLDTIELTSVSCVLSSLYVELTRVFANGSYSGYTPMDDSFYYDASGENDSTGLRFRTVEISSLLSEVTNGSALLAWLQANATKQ